MTLTGTQKFFIFFLLMTMFVVVGQRLDFDPQQSQQFLATHSPVLSSLIFIFLYVVGTFFIWFGPKDVLRVASAVVFGALWSSLLVYVGEMLNMVTMFWFSRKMGRAFIEQRFQGKMKNLDETVSNSSTAAIFFMRFYPYVPFRFLDLGYGLTKISFRRYALVSLIAAPIRVYVIQYFLSLGLGTALNPVQLQNYLADRPELMFWNSLYFLSSLVYLAILIFRRKKKSSEDN